MHSKTGDDKRKRGVVKWYSERLGYGFAEVEGEVDEVFIHRTALAQFGLTRLLVDDIVKVSVTDSPRGRIVDVLYGAERLPVDERLIGSVPDADEHFARVKFFNALRGYGFIEVQGYDQDIFVHSRIIERNGLSTIYQGQRLLVTVEEGDKSWQVRTIRLLADEDGEVPWAQKQAEAGAGGVAKGEGQAMGGTSIHANGNTPTPASSTTADTPASSNDIPDTPASSTTADNPASSNDIPDTTTTDTPTSTDDNAPTSTTTEVDGDTDASDSTGSNTSSDTDASEGGGEK
ncbi:MAG: cold shock domain-containing protein [Proteobacteria bacterium]|nr:cold shock domain-containing protein [Pseudomonadota bacterium]